MRGVVDYGTGAGLRPRFGLTGDLAGKTGTTQDNTDGWFILMHPQLVAGAWVGFNDNRVTMRSSYWGQGAHNALFIVGDMMQQAEKSGVVDAKASFSAPHMKDEEKPLMDRVGDWWNSVFNSAPSDPTVAAVPPVTLPEVKLDSPQLQPPPPPLPPSLLATPQMPSSLGVSPDAPVIASDPQRVPSFPRPLDTGRPVETIPGTQVYRSPDVAARPPDASAPADVVRGPAQPRVAGSMPAGTAAMGAAPSQGGAARDATASGAAGGSASGSSEASASSRRESSGSGSYGTASGSTGGSSLSSSGTSTSGDSDSSSVGTASGSPSASQ
jgi:penicillin-binding protein 1A